MCYFLTNVTRWGQKSWVNPRNTQDAHKPTLQTSPATLVNVCVTLQGCSLSYFSCLWTSLHIFKKLTPHLKCISTSCFKMPRSAWDKYIALYAFRRERNTAKACRRGYYLHLQWLLQCFQTSLQLSKPKTMQQSCRFKEKCPKITSTVIQAIKEKL